MIDIRLGYESSEDDVRSKLALLSEGTSDPILVAVDGERLLGVIALHWAPMLHLAAKLARITALVVRADTRGIGVGRRLVDAGAALARNAGCSQLELTTAVRRADAQAFYRAIGFTESSVRLVRALPMVRTQSVPDGEDGGDRNGQEGGAELVGVMITKQEI
jgi:ribosomal protein S18 acetylase RimI-like enzyme